MSELSAFTVTVKNTGDVDVYFVPSFELDLEEGIKEFTKDFVDSLGSGRSKDIVFTGVELTDADISKNKEVTVTADYGSREEFLTKKATKDLELETLGGGADYGFVVFLSALLLILILLLLLAKRRKEKR